MDITSVESVIFHLNVNIDVQDINRVWKSQEYMKNNFHMRLFFFLNIKKSIYW